MARIIRRAAAQQLGRPQVNLLPPGQIRRLNVRSARRLIGVLGTTFIIANGILISYGAASQSLVNRQLETAQQQTQSLQTELSKNSEAITLSDEIEALQNDRIAVTAREADLQQLLTNVRASTPANMQITNFDLRSVGASSTGSSSATDKPTASDIGTISIVATSSDLPNISQWIDNVRKVHGVSGITAQQVDNLADQSASSSEAQTGFTSQLTIVLSTDVFTHRFAQQNAIQQTSSTTPVTTATHSESQQNGAQQ